MAARAARLLALGAVAVCMLAATAATAQTTAAAATTTAKPNNDKTCTQPVDLMFLLDGSSSIDVPDDGGKPGNFKKVILEFVKAVAQRFNLGKGDSESRIAVGTFSSPSAKDGSYAEGEASLSLCPCAYTRRRWRTRATDPRRP